MMKMKAIKRREEKWGWLFVRLGASHKQTCLACLGSIYRSCWFSLKKPQAVLYSIISTNTPKINHSSSKACGNNWDLTVIQMSRCCRNIRQVSFSRYSLDALFKSYQVTGKR